MMSQDILSVLQAQHAFFHNGSSRCITFARAQLHTLKRLLQEHETTLVTALSQDLGKPYVEAYTTELLLVLQEIDHALRNICTWTSAHYVKTPWILKPATSSLLPEPRGQILIIAPWNYPILLTLLPAIGAIAAGNCIIIKPSEHAPHTSRALCALLNTHFDPGFLRVIEGDHTTVETLLTYRFDHIFFTGNKSGGKRILQWAAQHLTPVTLELGGKCPTIVHHDADIMNAAKKIVWAKFLNAGQSCVAPDYLLVHTSVKKSLVDNLIRYIETFYGKDPATSNAYGRIINSHHLERIRNLLANTAIIYGGTINTEICYIAPTLINEPQLESLIMQDEIFGPVLPIISYENFDDALKIINTLDHPLAIYLFTHEQKIVDTVAAKTTSGSICINDIMMQAASPYLPFGGVGASGFGAYHGKTSFDTFSHHKSIFHTRYMWNFLVRYPPYTRLHSWYLRLLRWLHR